MIIDRLPSCVKGFFSPSRPRLSKPQFAHLWTLVLAILVNLRSTKLVREPTLTLLRPDGNRRSWESGGDVIVGPSLLEREQDVTAEVVFAGYGIDAPGQGIRNRQVQPEVQSVPRVHPRSP